MGAGEDVDAKQMWYVADLHATAKSLQKMMSPITITRLHNDSDS